MHTAWIQSSGKIDECPLCISEHGDPRNPNFTPVDLLTSSPATRYPIPCPRHGDPTVCLPGNEDAISIYTLVNQNDNYIIRSYTDKQGKAHHDCYLDLGLCSQLCRAWPVVDVRETLLKLNIIHQELHHYGR